MTLAAERGEEWAITAPDIADATPARRYPGLAIAGITSLAAGAVHAAAIGVHAEHPQLARIFVAFAVVQLGAGLAALLRPCRTVAALTAAVNALAVGGWVTTRVTGISWIDGLEVREAAQFADTACAALGAIASGAAGAAMLVGRRPLGAPRLAVPALAAAALAVPAMVLGGTHRHAHDGATGAAHDHGSAQGATAGAAGSPTETTHSHRESENTGTAHDHTEEVATPTWPRPWNPAQPIDVSGVPGVSPEQEQRATALIEASLRELPRWSTTEAAVADGYRSIGDAGTGSEHFIKASLVQDDVLLDPTQPESLVFNVGTDGSKTLAGAMFIASARPTDDPELTEWAGPLMTWHNHGDLCWEGGSVVGVVDANGACARGNNGGGEFPMVHVWVTPHPCGVFAALEGIGAGQAAVPDAQRVDMCSDEHSHGGSTAGVAKPYDPTKPIDLSGTPGVTPEQQAAAENLIAVTIVRLPQWSDYRVAEAAGFVSIGDGLTGHEHFIQWDWINDDVILDPDQPESLVYEPQPDGSKRLVSAMYMLPDSVALADVPDIGGALMQWHIHDNLCFTTGDGPRVAGITDSGGNCPAGLQKFSPSAMIHVWITPHRCGPFAALDGVGAGQIEAGDERLCDEAHGSGH